MPANPSLQVQEGLSHLGQSEVSKSTSAKRKLWNPESVETVLALQVASYAMLAIRIRKESPGCNLLPQPKWAVPPN